MNQVFSFSRWRLLVINHWGENSKRYLLSLLAIGGLLIGWYSFILTMDKIDPIGVFFQWTAYYIGLYFVGCLYASTLFADLSSRTAGISFLALPASQLEKLLCAIFFGVVLFFIAYTVLFYLIDIPMVQLSNRLIERYPRNWPNSNEPVPALAVYNVFTAKAGPIGESDFHLWLLGYFVVQSAFLLGSVYFKRYSFIKTIVSALIFTLILTIFVKKAIFDTMPDDWQSNFFTWDQFNIHWVHTKTILLPPRMHGIVQFLLQYCLPPFFWVVTYFRIKEKEV